VRRGSDLSGSNAAQRDSINWDDVLPPVPFRKAAEYISGEILLMYLKAAGYLKEK
jgi:hypothetical protein